MLGILGLFRALPAWLKRTIENEQINDIQLGVAGVGGAPTAR